MEITKGEAISNKSVLLLFETMLRVSNIASVLETKKAPSNTLIMHTYEENSVLALQHRMEVAQRAATRAITKSSARMIKSRQ